MHMTQAVLEQVSLKNQTKAVGNSVQGGPGRDGSGGRGSSGMMGPSGPALQKQQSMPHTGRSPTKQYGTGTGPTRCVELSWCCSSSVFITYCLPFPLMSHKL